MIEFERTIGSSEANSRYFNLSDDHGRSFGPDLNLPHCTKIAVRDGRGRVTFAQKHHANQLWGMLTNWFIDNDVAAGTRVLVRFDPNERHDEYPVINLVPEGKTSAPEAEPESPAATAAAYASEIPIRLERQLEEFLAANPELIEPGLAMYRDEDGRPGQQYPTDVGVIDLLCRRRTGQLLVVELKRSKVSDIVVGQISRYIGWVKKHIADDADVAGLILCHDRDDALKYAVHAHANLSVRYFKIRLELVSEDQL